MQWIWAIVAGLVIGLIAKAVVPGKQDIPIWLTIVIGIIGAIVGNALASAFGVRQTGGIDWVRHILQVIVAVAGVYVVALIRGGRAAKT